MGRKGVIPPASYVRLVDLEAVVPLLYSGYKVLEEGIYSVIDGHNTVKVEGRNHSRYSRPDSLALLSARIVEHCSLYSRGRNINTYYEVYARPC